jgi:hypothetical protein
MSHHRRQSRITSRTGEASSFFLCVFALAGALFALLVGPDSARATAPLPSRTAAHPGASASVDGASPNDVLYPAQTLPLRFDHRAHVKKAGLSCLYCHTDAAVSRTSKDRLLPPAARCDACHGTNHDTPGTVAAGVGPAADCGYCHAGTPPGSTMPPRVVIPTPHVRFDHAAHVQRNVPCAHCHHDVEDGGLATRAALPEMRLCLECHRQGGAPSECSVCHETHDGKRLTTSFAEGNLLPPRWMHDAEHGPDWMLRHRTVAAVDSAFCAACHSERECTECHDGRVRPRAVHPNDWLNLHAMAARQNDPNCSSCHRAQSFCISCHQRTGVAETSPYANAEGRSRFHPPKAEWTDLPRTGRHHAFEAQRNITACVSCHTERDCASCHATAGRGGIGGLSPHPPGFAGTCRSALASNARPCLFCHTPGDPALASCR